MDFPGKCYKLGRRRGHDFTNIAVPRSILRVRNWTFDTWLSSGSSRHAKVDTKKKHILVHFFPIWGSGKTFGRPYVGWKKKKKVSTIGCLGELELNHVSKFQVQNPKTQRGTAKILISSLYFKFIWNIYEAITPARKRIETWKYYWSSSYAVTHVHTNL